MVSSHVLRVLVSEQSSAASSSTSRIGVAKHKALATPWWFDKNREKVVWLALAAAAAACCPLGVSKLRVLKISSLLVAGDLRLGRRPAANFARASAWACSKSAACSLGVGFCACCCCCWNKLSNSLSSRCSRCVLRLTSLETVETSPPEPWWLRFPSADLSFLVGPVPAVPKQRQSESKTASITIVGFCVGGQYSEASVVSLAC